jgi:hypothetical protein
VSSAIIATDPAADPEFSQKAATPGGTTLPLIAR